MLTLVAPPKSKAQPAKVQASVEAATSAAVQPTKEIQSGSNLEPARAVLPRMPVLN
jgi:hypothetical protein